MVARNNVIIISGLTATHEKLSTNMNIFLKNSLQMELHSLPIRVRYDMAFMIS